MRRAALSLAVVLVCLGATAALPREEKARLIVMTDLGGTDPDDTQSMIHLLAMADCVDIEGIISTQAWLDDPDRTGSVKAVLDRYGQVRRNLASHSDGYPTAQQLRAVTVRGQKKAHIAGVGWQKDSPGSKLIIKVVDEKSDPRPVWITAWGGMNTLAQALWTVRQTRSREELRRFVAKLRVYDVLGQDDAGAWIAANFPDLVYIRNTQVYGWAPDDAWTRANVQNRGILGRAYPDRVWATEGDSPAFLYVIANGLNDPEHPEWGGWGGRFAPQKDRNTRGMDFIASSGKDEGAFGDYYMNVSAEEGSQAISRWKEHINSDFAARMIWSTTPDYALANHHPTISINGDKSLKPLIVEATEGQDIELDASGTSDPDGDKLTYKWSVYSEPGRMTDADLSGTDTPCCRVQLPTRSRGELHIVLEVCDNGAPAITVGRRVVIRKNS